MAHPADIRFRERFGRYGVAVHGGSSSSQSSSSSSTSSDQYDQRATVGGDGLAVSGSGDVSFTDYGAIAGAKDVLEAGLEGAAKAVENVTDAFSQAFTENNKILAEKVESDQKEIGMLALKALILVGASVVALGILFKR
ncbi:hypothetical protein [Magnetovibrio blakemorei]|uniref:Uncharacterized protein n=1 Tax=Magnetovibrio blakemorei TaxID=28181 RepID=A0A1E5Q490_9PROT|nr:hypothetical protein [Magnetovibrio blakemorei]OEJ64650.1 hypothetical protein BEN30_00735 [Magnetovibrio blakemorei]